MESTKLCVYVSQEVALAAGSTRHGSAEYLLTDSDLAELGAEDRATLAASLDHRGDLHYGVRLASPEITWATVEPALRDSLARTRADLAKRRARDEQEIAKALAAPDEEWMHGWSSDPGSKRVTWEAASYVAGVSLSGLKGDPRIKARLASLEPELTRRQREADATWTRQQEEAKARRLATEEAEERRAEEAKRVRAQAHAELRAYAREVDHLARAAADGYEVHGAAVDNVAAEIAALDEDATVLVDGSPQYEAATWDERRAPRPEAFAVLDRVTKHVASVRYPACVTIDVSRVMRYTAPVEDDDGDWVAGPRTTAIIVTVSSPVTKDRAVVFPAER